MSNNDCICNISNLSPSAKSDHSVLQIECNFAVTENKRCKLNFNKGDYDGLINFIDFKFQSVKDNNVIDSTKYVEDQWLFFKDSLYAGIEKYIPISEYSLENNSWKQPLPKSTRRLIKRKHRLWTRYQTSNNKEV